MVVATLLELNGADEAERRMAPAGIVEAVDVAGQSLVASARVWRITRTFAGQNLVAVVVAAIGQDHDLTRADGLPGFAALQHELGPVVALVDDVMGHDEMKLGIDGDLWTL